MATSLLSLVRISWIATLLFISAVAGQSQQLPADVGTVVGGFQDDFDGATLNSGWAVRGANVYTVSDGQLHIAAAAGDPNHLLYEAGAYDTSVQEVLARMRLTSFGTGDGPRGGVAAGVDALSSQGINFQFRDETSGKHMEFLDDTRAWGTEFAFAWQLNTWYWVRLRHEPNAASQGGVNDVFGKIWLADGSAAEPTSWQTLYDYIPTRTARAGFAGLAAGSLGGIATFDVDYVLIKAAGLPNVTVAPRAFVQTPVAITNQPQDVTAVMCKPATLTVGTTGNPLPSFQWFRNSGGGFQVIAGATNPTLTFANVQLADNGSQYRVVAQNVVTGITHSVTSAAVTLTVSADTARPVLALAQPLGLSQLLVRFSEPVTALSANNAANYQITNQLGSIQISNAAVDVTGTNITLTCAPMVEGQAYTLVVNGVIDACAGNLVEPNSTFAFTVTSYAVENIGNAGPAGGLVPVAGGYDVTGGGADIGGTNDQFQFSWQQRTGDFDFKVRLASLELADSWTEAGLMARETLLPGSRYASALATPSISGCYFQTRTATNGASTVSGSFPANYPTTWLRLQRVGNQFTAYASYDGLSWTTLGNSSIAMPATIHLGFAVSSHNASEAATAAFRDFSPVTSTTTNFAPPKVEPLNQSSRRTSLVISEIMYHPLERADGRNTEFIEIFNALPEPQEISGYRLAGEAEFTFPTNTVLPAGGFLVVARVPADIQNVYGLTGVSGPFANTNNLSNAGGTIRLLHRTGAVLLEVNYSSDVPYPAATDGAGHSLILARPSYGEGQPEAWGSSDAVGGSPGRLDPVTLEPLGNVVINEVLAHTDDPEQDYIELYNHSNEAVDLSGCFLSDAAATNKFTIPSGTVIAPRGFAVFNQTTLGFALDSHGEEIYFRNAANTRVIDALRFGAQENGVSLGRWPEGAAALHRLATKTPGTSNTPPRQSEVVINEIMYNPISGNSADEFVELFNPGTSAINLYRWRLSGGISHTFKQGDVLPAGGYFVVGSDVDRLLSRYPNLSSANTVGNFNGSLANRGERLVLSKPEFEISTNGSGQIVTNTVDIAINEVAYHDGGRWGQWADGGGSSLELIDARADTRLAASWADSDETSKADWSVATWTGILDHPHTPGVLADHLEMFMQGSGECLVDDIAVIDATDVNRVANPSFEGGTTGWTAEGTQSGSSLETTEGFNSAQSYHLRAIERGDNQVNRVRTTLTGVVAAGSRATLRASVRWLRGHPEMLLRLRGNWLELPVAMAIPQNLGTPGARNSRALTNAVPAIHEVTHQPPLPRSAEPVVVTARVSDPDGVASLQVKYRVDPSATIVTLNMNDGGVNGDVVQGDGIYSATIPGQTVGTLVAFHVAAGDPTGATALFPNNAPTRECLIRFGEVQPFGSFPTYRVWMTQGTFNTWVGRHRLNNTPLDVTFVLNNTRVIYNSQALYAGSPYIAPGYNTPTGNRCGYTMSFPSDDRFLGGTDLVLDWPGGHGNEPTAIQEQMAYWLADQMNLPFSHRYFIRLHVNGVTEAQRGTIYEAVMQPAGEFINQWSFGEEDGDFYKIDRGFEFDDGGNRVAEPMPTLQPFVTSNLATGRAEKKQARYRWTFMKRSFESANDYTNIFGLVDALNGAAYDPYTAHTEGLVDVEQWMRVFAFEHTINNFDSYGHAIGKNMYAYKPEFGRWQLYAFDLDWLMLVSANSSSYGVNANLFDVNDPTILRMYNHPPFRRAYWRAYQEIVDGPLLNSEADAVMDAKYYSLVQNGVTQSEGAALQPPTALKGWWSGRRAYIVSQLQAQGSPFAVSNPLAFTTNNNLAEVRGTAPFSAHTIRFNGISYPITWTTQSNWLARIPLQPGANSITIAAYDRHGQPLNGMTAQMTINFSGAVESAERSVLFNEIVYRGTVPDSEYVELFNAATNTTFDLSGWRISGLDYTFPDGSLLRPRSYLVLARDRAVFAVHYGGAVPVFDEFPGNLQNNGETLTLIRPAGSSSEVDLVVDRVRYDSSLPWSTNANGTGSSLQLIDPGQENARALNWFSTYVPPVFSPAVSNPQRTNDGWRFVSITGPAGPGIGGQQMRLIMFLDEANGASALVDDISLVPGTIPEVGTNYVRNGDFETGPLLEVPQVTNSWNFGTNYTNTAIVGGLTHSGSGALRIEASTFGNSFPRLIAQQLSPAPITNAIHTLSFWYFATNSATNLNIRLFNSASLNVKTNINIFITPSNYIPPQLVSPATNSLSPGAANQIVTNLPAFAPLWINEVQAQNLTGIPDNNGEREPWIEIFNTSSNSVSLEGLYLSSSYTNLLQWAFPAGATIGPRQFLVVFCDGEPGETTASEHHTSFRLAAGGGSIALSRVHSSLPVALNGPAVLDYVNYAGIDGDRSYGSYPDGQPFDRFEFFYVTPRATNDGRSAPLVVFINEWMASNTNALADPADGDNDDWFELYNPGPNAVDLAGYYLTDLLSNPTKYQITTNGPHVIAPQGYLLVWADNETGQNMSGGLPRTDLHVNFQLARAGEGLGLFAPDGSQVDAITFTNQLDDVSEGRFPNGSANIVPMPGSTSPRASNYLQGGNPNDPEFTRAVRSGNNLELSWSTIAGRRYAVDYKDNLNDPTWTPLQTNTATGTGLSFTNTILNPPQRFFRIREVP